MAGSFGLGSRYFCEGALRFLRGGWAVHERPLRGGGSGVREGPVRDGGLFAGCGVGIRSPSSPAPPLVLTLGLCRPAGEGVCWWQMHFTWS